MKLLRSTCVALAWFGVLAPGLFSGAAKADTLAEVCQPFAATLDGGLGLGNDDTHHFNDTVDPNFAFDVHNKADYRIFFGDAAARYKFCNTDLNAQIDASYVGNKFQYGFEDTWHAGGILFLRDQSIGLLGIDGSYIARDQHYDFVSPDTRSKWLRFGVRGEWFAGENVTLGARVGHIDGDTSGFNLNGFDESVWARIYATSNLALTAKLDAGQFDYTGDKISDWAISADAEYLIPDQQVSLFGGARYAMKHSTFLGNANIPNTLDDQYASAFVGLKIYLGTAARGNTLVSQQRNNTLDNTSMLFERLPGSDGFMSIPNNP